MPDQWYPGALVDPGDAAGYTNGHNEDRLCAIHMTDGFASYNLVKNGNADAPSTLAQGIIPREGRMTQFAEVTALCYDSPPNIDGCGWEIECRAERDGDGNIIYMRPGLALWYPTDSQLAQFGGLVRWLSSEHGYPLDLYDGPRVHGTIPGFRGFANHGDIDRNRSDGVTREQWDRALALSSGTPATTTPPPNGESVIYIDFSQPGKCSLFDAGLRLIDFAGPPNLYGIPEDASQFSNGQIPIRQVNPLQWLVLEARSLSIAAAAKPFVSQAATG